MRKRSEGFSHHTRGSSCHCCAVLCPPALSCLIPSDKLMLLDDNGYLRTKVTAIMERGLRAAQAKQLFIQSPWCGELLWNPRDDKGH